MSGRLARNEFVVRDKESGELQVIDMDTGEIISSETNLLPQETFAFSYELAMLICQKVADGATLSELDEDPSLPPLHIIQHWRRSQPMFDAELKLARKQRADIYHDRIADIARNAGNLLYGSKEDLANAKLAADQYRWLAEKGNPDSYGNKVTHEGSTEKPITMRVINTGINRSLPDITANKEVHDDGEEEEIREGSYRELDEAERGDDEENGGDGAGSEEHSTAGKDNGSSQESSEEGV